MYYRSVALVPSRIREYWQGKYAVQMLWTQIPPTPLSKQDAYLTALLKVAEEGITFIESQLDEKSLQPNGLEEVYKEVAQLFVKLAKLIDFTEGPSCKEVQNECISDPDFNVLMNLLHQDLLASIQYYPKAVLSIPNNFMLDIATTFGSTVIVRGYRTGAHPFYASIIKGNKFKPGNGFCAGNVEIWGQKSEDSAENFIRIQASPVSMASDFDGTDAIARFKSYEITQRLVTGRDGRLMNFTRESCFRYIAISNETGGHVIGIEQVKNSTEVEICEHNAAIMRFQSPKEALECLEVFCVIYFARHDFSWVFLYEKKLENPSSNDDMPKLHPTSQSAPKTPKIFSICELLFCMSQISLKETDKNEKKKYLDIGVRYLKKHMPKPYEKYFNKLSTKLLHEESTEDDIMGFCIFCEMFDTLLNLKSDTTIQRDRNPLVISSDIIIKLLLEASDRSHRLFLGILGVILLRHRKNYWVRLARVLYALAFGQISFNAIYYNGNIYNRDFFQTLDFLISSAVEKFDPKNPIHWNAILAKNECLRCDEYIIESHTPLLTPSFDKQNKIISGGLLSQALIRDDYAPVGKESAGAYC